VRGSKPNTRPGQGGLSSDAYRRTARKPGPDAAREGGAPGTRSSGPTRCRSAWGQSNPWCSRPGRHRQTSSGRINKLIGTAVAMASSPISTQPAAGVEREPGRGTAPVLPPCRNQCEGHGHALWQTSGGCMGSQSRLLASAPSRPHAQGSSCGAATSRTGRRRGQDADSPCATGEGKGRSAGILSTIHQVVGGGGGGGGKRHSCEMNESEEGAWRLSERSPHMGRETHDKEIDLRLCRMTTSGRC